MTLHLLKADPSTDLYLVWEVETGTPLVVGHRDDITGYRHPEHRTLGTAKPIAQADQFGTSDGKDGFCHWDAQGLRLGEQVAGSQRWISRATLLYFAMAVDLGRRDLIEAVTMPYDPARRHRSYQPHGPAMGTVYAAYHRLDIEEGRIVWANRTARLS
ncbi:hypothetical protein [Nonomuraea bangladeshensis]|uniref:hypothetical protein n=1 Tax=Nonomuraea bangladeshensis TaxID=404385 RepID=UPI0031E15E7F